MRVKEAALTKTWTSYRTGLKIPSDCRRQHYRRKQMTWTTYRY